MKIMKNKEGKTVIGSKLRMVLWGCKREGIKGNPTHERVLGCNQKKGK